MMNHTDLPQMTEDFDRRVRQTLQDLPAQPQRARRRPFRTLIAVGAAAALCIGGTAFAASDLPQQIQRHFSLLFQGADEQLLNGHTITPAPGALVDENDAYRVSVESVLFDESAGTGVVSLHLANKKKDGVMPFSTTGTLEQYKGDNIVWSDLAECMANEDGQLTFDVWFGQSDWCAGKFYLNEARSTPNDYYIEGAFIPVGNYTASDGSLRLEVGEQGKYTVDDDGMTRLSPLLTVTLPAFTPLPYYQSADGLVTLSQIGLRVGDPEMNCVVDELDYIAVHMKDGTELVIQDKQNSIDRTLYVLGQGSGSAGEGYDVGTYVLAKTFELENVQSVVLNDTEYPLTA